METRTNIVLDDALVEQAMARAGVKTKKAAIEAALRAFVRKPDYTGLLALVGTGVIADDYDPKALFHAQPHVAEPQAGYQVSLARPAKRAASVVDKAVVQVTVKAPVKATPKSTARTTAPRTK